MSNPPTGPEPYSDDSYGGAILAIARKYLHVLPTKELAMSFAQDIKKLLEIALEAGIKGGNEVSFEEIQAAGPFCADCAEKLRKWANKLDDDITEASDFRKPN